MTVVIVVVVVVVCGDVGYGPALVPEVSAAGGPALVGVEGLLLVPLFPVGSGAFDAVCLLLVIVTAASSLPPLLSWLVLVVMGV